MAKKKQEYQASTAVRRIISLNNGQGARVTDSKGKNHQFDDRHSVEFANAIDELNVNMNGHGDRELERLGWDMPAVPEVDPAG